MPGDKAAGAMSHVEGTGRIGETVGGQDANHCGDTPLQCKLHLCLMCVPWCE